MAAAGESAGIGPVDPQQGAEAIMLDLMNPAWPSGG